MNSLWNFDINGFPIPPQDPQFNNSSSSWVPVMQPQQQQQPPPQQPPNWPEMAPVSSGYLHEIPNPNVAPDEGFFEFDFDFGHQKESSVTMPYQQDLGIGSCYPNGSLSDILVSGNAGYAEQNMKRSIAPENPILDLNNFPADSSVWPEFDSEPIVIPSQAANPGSSLVTGDYSGGMTSQVIDDLNQTPVKAIEKAPQSTKPVQFAPDTPDHLAQLERQELNAILISLTDETVDHAKDKGKTVVNSSSDELLHNVVDPYMQKEGNGSSAEEAIDLNQTPQQKAAAPKRRKYTPKVIKENKPQRGRKSTTPKAAAAAGQTSKAAENPPKSAKRKYVRKQGKEAEITPTPPAQQAEGNNRNTQEDLAGDVQGKQSAKRALNFDLEDVMEANSAIRAQTVPQVSNLYTRSSIPYAQNLQQGGGTTLEDAVNESSVLRNQNLNINLRPQAPGLYSRSGIPSVQGNPPLHVPVTRQSGLPNQHRPEMGNVRFHTGTIAGMGMGMGMGMSMGMGRTASSQQCNNPGAVLQGRTANLNHTVNHAVNSRQALLNNVSQAMLNMARGNQPPSNGQQQQRPALNPSSVWQRMLSTFPAAQQSMSAQQNITGRTDLPSQGRSVSAATNADWGESGIFRNGFLQAMAESQCLSPQHNLYGRQQQHQLRTPSKEETSAVTQLHDSAPMSQANRVAPITPEKMEKLMNQNAVQVNRRGRKRIDLSNPEATNPTNNVKKGQRGRPPKIQPSASDTREAGAIVPYLGGDGAIVPYEARKRKMRPKVDLDPETNRVWNVLMGKEASDEHEDKKREKEKWWQTEREVFRGRADSFIARMHQVQGKVTCTFTGDRRFSRWKGSVVDSVIGVFLTQNVSDHLSSSAFMALVAAFPAKSRDPQLDKGKAIIVEEPEDLMSNANKLIPRFPFELNRSPMAVHSLIWRDCFGSPTERTCILEAQSHSTEEEGISSQGSCVTPLEDLCQKSEGINGSTSKAYQVSENGYSQSNYEGCEQTDLAKQKQVEYVDGFSDGSYPPGFENQHFPVPSVSSNLHHLEMNLKQNTVEGYDDESTSTSSKRPKVSETTQERNIQALHTSTAEGSHPERKNSIEDTTPVKAKGKKAPVEEKIDWDKLRRDVQADGQTIERSRDAMDTLDYEALRKAPVEKISETIRARGMNKMLAERIKDFLDRLVEDHGSVDLEWLRDVSPDMAKDYLLSIRGLGLKSVECVRLLTLHNLAFPVDTNVGRIAVRLGWVPLEPLPEELQIHLLEVYPLLESVQKYLWPRLCKLDQRTLYELHYQLITFGKVFCTKTKPNCNACPMRGDCRHFASAFASAKLALPGPEEKKIVSCDVPLAECGLNASVNPTSLHQIEAEKYPAGSPSVQINLVQLFHMEDKAADQPGPGPKSSVQPIIEEPASPEPDNTAVLEHDIEDWYVEDDEDEIPTINLNMEAFTKNLERVIQENNGDLDGPSMSRALVAMDPRLSSLPAPQLKNVSRLRTEHQVYELPDDHYLLQGMQRRELDDPSPYLLAIWAPGETKDSTGPSESKCILREAGQMCNDKKCFSCNSIREDKLQVVRGTILIPCRTAMKGSFPLNGTYFQVNEMFADHESSHNPINVPRNTIWNLRRRIVYFGTSVTSIFRGLTTEQIQHCFWRGFVCVRAFDRLSGAPRPLVKRLHLTPSKAKPSDEE